MIVTKWEGKKKGVKCELVMNIFVTSIMFAEGVILKSFMDNIKSDEKPVVKLSLLKDRKMKRNQ
jgi:hypothetical protein